MPENVSTSTGEMAIGGSAKTAMFTPRNSRSSIGESTKAAPATMATALPMTKPRKLA
jgi:hypothetical protein